MMWAASKKPQKTKVRVHSASYRGWFEKRRAPLHLIDRLVLFWVRPPGHAGPFPSPTLCALPDRHTLITHGTIAKQAPSDTGPFDLVRPVFRDGERTGRTRGYNRSPRSFDGWWGMPSKLAVDRNNSAHLLGVLSAKHVRGPVRNACMDHRRPRHCSNWNESNFCISREQIPWSNTPLYAAKHKGVDISPGYYIRPIVLLCYQRVTSSKLNTCSSTTCREEYFVFKVGRNCDWVLGFGCGFRCCQERLPYIV